jgi:type I restriction enzyme S subunit
MVKPSYFQDSNIVWIENNQLNVKNAFLFFVLNEIKYESEGSTIQRLYNSIIKRAKFPLPPLPEQKAIAKVLSDTDSLIESLGSAHRQEKGHQAGSHAGAPHRKTPSPRLCQEHRVQADGA